MSGKNLFAGLFKPAGAEMFTSPLLRSRTTTAEAEPSSKPDQQAHASATAQATPAEPSGRQQTGNSPRPPLAPSTPPATSRPDAVQHSSSISGLGMTELLDQLDRATGRIHAFAGRGKGSGSHSPLDANPQLLLRIAGACLVVGQWRYLLLAASWLCSVPNLCTLIGVCCLLLAANTYLVRGFNLLTANVIALTLAVPKLPRMADEISEMLVEIRLMRGDLQSMRAKVNWLPGS